MTDDYTLGQPVTFRTHLVRGWGAESDHRGGAKEWQPYYVRPKAPRRTGIVIGRRTLSNGRWNYGSYDDPGVYTAREHFTAYLVVETMNSKPVHVLPEDLAPAEPAQDQPAPTAAAPLPGQIAIDL